MRIGPMEMLLIAIVIVAVVGYKNLPALGKKAGKGLKELKEQQSDIIDTVKMVKGEVNELKDIVSFNDPKEATKDAGLKEGVQVDEKK